MPFSTPNYLCNQNRASVWNGKTAILCIQCTFSTSIRIPNRANLKSSESDIEPCWCTSVLNSLSTVCHSKFYEYFKIYIHTHSQRTLCQVRIENSISTLFVYITWNGVCTTLCYQRLDTVSLYFFFGFQLQMAAG